jgi:hypothetical protein
MELIIYNKENATSIAAGRKKQPAISFSKSGLITVNKEVVQKLNLSAEMGIEIAQDPKDTTDWFYRFNENGLPLRYKESKGVNDGSLVCNSALICNKVRTECDIEGSGRCMVSVEPTYDGWMPIFTSSAK